MQISNEIFHVFDTYGISDKSVAEIGGQAICRWHASVRHGCWVLDESFDSPE